VTAAATIAISVNGTAMYGDTEAVPSAVAASTGSGGFVIKLATSDFVQIVAFQTSGVAQTIAATARAEIHYLHA